MFQTTRLKLTLWYMMILIFISVCFSAVIYRLMGSEVDRFARMQQFRMERRVISGVIVPLDGPPVSIEIYDPDLISDIKNRLVFSLFVINVSIWSISSVLAYLLAGKTLRPIQIMVQEQHRFISDASHELKTPLTSLKTAFEVFSRDSNSTLSEAKVLIQESIGEVNKLQALSENLLQLAQYQTPSNHSKFDRVALEDVIKRAVKTITPVAKQKNVTIKVIAKSLTVFGNKYALTDLVTILLDNAVKYSPQNSTVFVEMKSNAQYTTFTVSDQGEGIDKADLPHIFDRFYRTDTARSRENSGGYGLGLAIAKKIVLQHEGKIDVKSTVKKGTTFTIKLPLMK